MTDMAVSADGIWLCTVRSATTPDPIQRHSLAKCAPPLSPQEPGGGVEKGWQLIALRSVDPGEKVWGGRGAERKDDWAWEDFQTGALAAQLPSVTSPGDNIRSNGTSPKWTPPLRMPPESGGIP